MLANRAQISRGSAQQFQLNSSSWSMKRRKTTDRLLSRLNPMPDMEMLRSEERVAIVVITHNRREAVLRTLKRHARLPKQPPIIVVDNASVNGTACAVAEQSPGSRCFVRLAIWGLPRTLGVRYVALCDDDTWWSPEFPSPRSRPCSISVLGWRSPQGVAACYVVAQVGSQNANAIDLVPLGVIYAVASNRRILNHAPISG
jgi:hypothetical protein